MCTIKKNSKCSDDGNNEQRPHQPFGKKVCHPQNALAYTAVCAPAPEKEEAIGLVCVCCVCEHNWNKLNVFNVFEFS